VTAQSDILENRVDEGRYQELRANAYSLLAHLLAAAPTEDTLGRLRDIEGTNRQTPTEQSGSLGPAWGALRDAAIQADPRELQREYHALFIGLGSGEVVPYASRYLTGYLNDRPLADLRDDLARLGFERRPGVCEPEDHASAICEVMALIVTDAAPDELDEQRQFFGRHIAPWMQTLFTDLANAPSARFYQAVGTLGRKLMEMEGRYLGVGAASWTTRQRPNALKDASF
jgi:TorA maturation chaperone TorD